jgi:peptidoglycan-N-acetylglucosamine deacetylase
MRIPHRTPFFLPYLFPSSLVWRIPEPQRTLYLTFDDGPVPGPTEFVLETLREHEVKATFFCIGDNVRKHPDVFSRVVNEGHSIGNHTFNHFNGWKYSPREYIGNVQKCEAIFRDNGVVTNLFRPPYGRITKKQVAALNDYHIIMWDVLSIDYDKTLSPERCLRNTLNALRPGSIVVFHDSYKAEKNLAYALPRLLNHVKERGFLLKPIPVGE